MSSGSGADASLTAKIQIINASMQALEDAKRHLKELKASLEGTGTTAKKVQADFQSMNTAINSGLGPLDAMKTKVDGMNSVFRSGASSATAYGQGLAQMSQQSRGALTSQTTLKGGI